jgi:hypothetical protein
VDNDEFETERLDDRDPRRESSGWLSRLDLADGSQPQSQGKRYILLAQTELSPLLSEHFAESRETVLSKTMSSRRGGRFLRCRAPERASAAGATSFRLRERRRWTRRPLKAYERSPRNLVFPQVFAQGRLRAAPGASEHEAVG